jgi:hypothetical protein
VLILKIEYSYTSTLSGYTRQVIGCNLSPIALILNIQPRKIRKLRTKQNDCEYQQQNVLHGGKLSVRHATQTYVEFTCGGVLKFLLLLKSRRGIKLYIYKTLRI